VPVAAEVADALDAPLDVIVVRKLGVPSQPELAMGAIGEDGVIVRNDEVIRHLGIQDASIERVATIEREELRRRAARFRGNRPMIPLDDRTVLIVDDGLATGSTARAAILVARAHGASRVVLAVPVAPPESLVELAPVADEILAVATPSPFLAIGQWYRDFRQTTDEEVSRLLAGSRPEPAPGDRSPSEGGGEDRASDPRP
jgi:predicted phosphoribosyltransferase